MSDLSSLEKRKLEQLFEMSGGYVINFSDRTFKDFFLDTVGIDIEQDKYYQGASGSKANRLREFWRQEPNIIVGKLILGLLEWYKVEKSGLDKNDLWNECYKIAQRLAKNVGNEVDEIIIDAHFEDCQNKIIEQVKLAKFIIWVAVAWFTDPILFNLLLEKKQQGVNIQIIINDDQINQNSGLNYHEFECYQIPEIGKYKNIMHNKFCVIDLKTVIHGSYNWTKKAQYNHETLEIVSSRENAEKYAEEFLKLKMSYLTN